MPQKKSYFPVYSGASDQRKNVVADLTEGHSVIISFLLIDPNLQTLIGLYYCWNRASYFLPYTSKMENLESGLL